MLFYLFAFQSLNLDLEVLNGFIVFAFFFVFSFYPFCLGINFYGSRDFFSDQSVENKCQRLFFFYSVFDPIKEITGEKKKMTTQYTTTHMHSVYATELYRITYKIQKMYIYFSYSSLFMNI